MIIHLNFVVVFVVFVFVQCSLLCFFDLIASFPLVSYSLQFTFCFLSFHLFVLLLLLLLLYRCHSIITCYRCVKHGFGSIRTRVFFFLKKKHTTIISHRQHYNYSSSQTHYRQFFFTVSFRGCFIDGARARWRKINKKKISKAQHCKSCHPFQAHTYMYSTASPSGNGNQWIFFSSTSFHSFIV